MERTTTNYSFVSLLIACLYLGIKSQFITRATAMGELSFSHTKSV